MVLGEEFELTMSRAWWQFIHELVPRLVDDDDFVRGVLRCVEALPARDAEKASVELRTILLEMDL